MTTSTLIQRGSEAIKAGEHRLAVECFEQALRDRPDDADALKLCGIAKAELGSLRDAESLLQASLRIRPDDADGYYNLSIVQSRTGDLSAAAATLRAALTLRPGHGKARLNLALLQQQSGSLDEALINLNQLLTLEPANTDARLARGTVLQALERSSDALEDFRYCASIAKADSRMFFHLADCLRTMGNSEEAIVSVDQALTLQPRSPDALWLRALLSFQQGDHLSAVKTLRTLVSVQPNRSRLYLLLGICFRELGRPNEALQAFDLAVQSDPGDVDAHTNHALALATAGRHADAVRNFRTASELQPENPEHLLNLGLALKECDDLHGALAEYDRATRIEPNFALAHYNAAIVYHALDRLTEAVASNDKALQADPNLVVAHVNRGAFCQLAKDFSGAKVSYERALALEPANAGAEWNLALLELGEGNFERGFELYESRLRNNALASLYTDEIPFPRWDGAPVPVGSRILVLHEQGLGDTIQYARYLRLMGQRGIRVTVLAPRPLHRLLRSLPGVESVHDTLSGKLSFDYFCYIMSLAGIFETRLDAVPFGNEPYLTTDPQLIEKWRSILPNFATGRGIGLMWSGGNISKIRGRSMSLPALSGLLQSSHEFVSLQKDLSEADAKLVAELPNLRHYGAQQEDFADAAAIIANLDLVITVDTSIAHLSGALGKETWVMVPFSADWRWLENRDDSPWYPNMRIFRQRTSGQWQPVVEEILAALANRYRAI